MYRIKTEPKESRITFSFSGMDLVSMPIQRLAQLRALILKEMSGSEQELRLKAVV